MIFILVIWICDVGKKYVLRRSTVYNYQIMALDGRACYVQRCLEDDDADLDIIASLGNQALEEYCLWELLEEDELRQNIEKASHL